jgi:predicted ATPase
VSGCWKPYANTRRSDSTHRASSWPSKRVALRTLEGEIDNLRAVAERARAIGQADLTIRLVWEAWQFWWLKGHLDESRRWLGEVEDSGALERLGESDRTYFHAAQAILLFWSARHENAVGHADVAIDALRSSGDVPNTAMLLLVRGMSIALSGGDLASARKDVAEARRIEESLGDKWLAGFVWNAEGYLAKLAGDVDATVAALERAAMESNRSGVPTGATRWVTSTLPRGNSTDPRMASAGPWRSVSRRA